MKGYILLHRQMLENPTVNKDSDYFAVWVYLLLNAAHCPRRVIFNGKEIELKSGQLVTGRKKISDDQHISESKVDRILRAFVREQQIEQQMSNRNRLISILNWDKYQINERQIEQQVNRPFAIFPEIEGQSFTKIEQQNEQQKMPEKFFVSSDTEYYLSNIEHQSEQQANNKRTTSEQQANTNNKLKELNNYINNIIQHLNEKANAEFEATIQTRRIIERWIEQGYSESDFIAVIDKKSDEWIGTSFERYLRPSTLFGDKFENYLHQKIKKSKSTFDIAEYEKFSMKGPRLRK